MNCVEAKGNSISRKNKADQKPIDRTISSHPNETNKCKDSSTHADNKSQNTQQDKHIKAPKAKKPKTKKKCSK